MDAAVPEHRYRTVPARSRVAEPARELVPARPSHPVGLRPSRIPARPSPAGHLPVQAKLTAGVAGDRYEQEADRFAAAVARRQPAQPADDPGGGIAGSFPVSRFTGGNAAGAAAETAIRQARGGGQPLDGAVRGTMEAGLRADFSGVRVHRDRRARVLNEALHATAFTSGRDVFLGADAPGPATPEGRRLVAHELTHVLQQDAASALQCSSPPLDLKVARKRHDEVVKDHKAQSQVLKRWIEDGLASKDVLLVNSCEWIKRDLSRVYAATRTGDSYARVTHKGGNPDKTIAFFPAAINATESGDIDHPDGADYDYTDLENDTGIRFDGSGIRAWNATENMPTAIAFTNVPTNTGLLSFLANETRNPVTRDQFFVNLKHEVQHAADRHRVRLDELLNQSSAPRARDTSLRAALERLSDALSRAKPYDPNDLAMLPPGEAAVYLKLHTAKQGGGQQADPADIQVLEDFQRTKLTEMKARAAEREFRTRLEKFKTEYRAYSYQGTYGKYDNTQAYATTDFVVSGRAWTERQYKIFSHLHATYPDIKAGWDTKTTGPGGKTFREEVLDYRDPDVAGVNKLNSVRVNDCYDKLLQIPVGAHPVDQQKLDELTDAIKALTPVEGAYLYNKPAAPREFSGELARRIADPATRAGIDRLLELRATA